MQTLGLERYWWPQRADEDAYQCILIPSKECQKYWYNDWCCIGRMVHYAPVAHHIQAMPLTLMSLATDFTSSWPLSSKFV